MTDDTIEKTFSMNEWKESDCDVCCGRTGVVLLADQRVCYDCLLNSFDESGDPIITDEELEAAYTPEPVGKLAMNTIIATLFLLMPVALLAACLLFENEEVRAFLRRV